MMKALQGIFQPGASRHKAKRYHRDAELITGISTMRCMSADVHQFARFIRINWPEVKHLVRGQARDGASLYRGAGAARAVRWKDWAGLRFPAQAGHCLPQGRHLPSDAPPCCPTKIRADQAVSTRNRSRSLTPKSKPRRSLHYIAPSGSCRGQAAHADVGGRDCASAKPPSCAPRISIW